MNSCELVKMAQTLQDLLDRTATPVEDTARAGGRGLLEAALGTPLGALGGLGTGLGLEAILPRYAKEYPHWATWLPTVGYFGGALTGLGLGGLHGTGAARRNARQRHANRANQAASVMDRLKMLVGM